MSEREDGGPALPLANNIEVKISGTLTFEHAPGCGVTLYKNAISGKTVTLTLSASEFRALHRAMAAAEPFIYDAARKESSK